MQIKNFLGEQSENQKGVYEAFLDVLDVLEDDEKKLNFVYKALIEGSEVFHYLLANDQRKFCLFLEAFERKGKLAVLGKALAKSKCFLYYSGEHIEVSRLFFMSKAIEVLSYIADHPSFFSEINVDDLERTFSFSDTFLLDHFGANSFVANVVALDLMYPDLPESNQRIAQKISIIFQQKGMPAIKLRELFYGSEDTQTSLESSNARKLNDQYLSELIQKILSVSNRQSMAKQLHALTYQHGVPVIKALLDSPKIKKNLGRFVSLLVAQPRYKHYKIAGGFNQMMISIARGLIFCMNGQLFMYQPSYDALKNMQCYGDGHSVIFLRDLTKEELHYFIQGDSLRDLMTCQDDPDFRAIIAECKSRQIPLIDVVRGVDPTADCHISALAILIHKAPEVLVKHPEVFAHLEAVDLLQPMPVNIPPYNVYRVDVFEAILSSSQLRKILFVKAPHLITDATNIQNKTRKAKAKFLHRVLQHRESEKMIAEIRGVHYLRNLIGVAAAQTQTSAGVRRNTPNRLNQSKGMDSMRTVITPSGTGIGLTFDEAESFLNYMNEQRKNTKERLSLHMLLEQTLTEVDHAIQEKYPILVAMLNNTNDCVVRYSYALLVPTVRSWYQKNKPEALAKITRERLVSLLVIQMNHYQHHEIEGLLKKFEFTPEETTQVFIKIKMGQFEISNACLESELWRHHGIRVHQDQALMMQVSFQENRFDLPLELYQTFTRDLLDPQHECDSIDIDRFRKLHR